ncbi:MAG TPA: peptidylprolyl isomerase [Stellaceae bacterium]|nr:peptidylprolyl isomerase [Stellaceae bacterium]
MRPIRAFFLPLLLLSASAMAQEAKVAAIVNDDVVSADDVANRVTLVVRSSHMQDTPENRDRITPQVLRSLIDERLELQEAKRLNISVSKQEIAEAFGRIEQTNNLPKGSLDEYLAKAGISRASLVDQITANYAWAKLVRNRLSQDVVISDEQVTEALNHLKEAANVPQDRVSEIFLVIDNPRQEPEVKQLADKLIEQIRSGVKFDALARQFSQSPTAAVGGDLGWVTPSELLPPVADAIQKMNPGEMSYPVRAGGGYYLLLLKQRRTLGAPDPNDAVLSMVQVVLPLQRGGATPVADERGGPRTQRTTVPAAGNASPEEEQRVLQRAQQIGARAKSCEDLAKIGKADAPQTSREVETRVGDLSPQLRQVLLKLAIGEASKPLPVPGGAGIFMVCAKKDAPGGLPTRDEEQEMLSREKLDALAQRYLRDLRRNAYVDIRG